MKKSLALLTAALWPVAAIAQNAPKAVPSPAPTPAPTVTPAPAPAEGQDPFAAPAPPPPVPTLDRVEFQDADLPSIIEFLKKKNEQLGGNQRDLNIIVTPGLEKLRVPMLALRNVTVTDVLTIATTVLDVQLVPVANQTTGETVAWIVKAAAPNQEAVAGGFIGGFVPAPGTATVAPGTAGGNVSVGGGGSPEPGNPPPDGTPGATTGPPSGNVIQYNPVTPTKPHVVELASGGGGLAGHLTATPTSPPRTEAKVFGIASLITSARPDPDERMDERSRKFSQLINSLKDLASDQGRKADVKAYNDMDILIVKSEDPEAIRLITDVIDALKMNAASDKPDPGQSPKKETQKSGAH